MSAPPKEQADTRPTWPLPYAAGFALAAFSVAVLIPTRAVVSGVDLMNQAGTSLHDYAVEQLGPEYIPEAWVFQYGLISLMALLLISSTRATISGIQRRGL